MNFYPSRCCGSHFLNIIFCAHTYMLLVSFQVSELNTLGPDSSESRYPHNCVFSGSWLRNDTWTCEFEGLLSLVWSPTGLCGSRMSNILLDTAVIPMEAAALVDVWHVAPDISFCRCQVACRSLLLPTVTGNCQSAWAICQAQLSLEVKLHKLDNYTSYSFERYFSTLIPSWLLYYASFICIFYLLLKVVRYEVSV